MKVANEPTGNEFSVRDQFAGTDPARLTSKGVAVPTGTGASSARSPDPLTPLRRPVTPETMFQVIDWSQVARGVWRRVWIIVLVTALGASLGLYGRARMGKPRYEARASVLYRAERQKQTLSSPGASVSIKGLARATATSLLRRAGNLEQVTANLKLDMTPADFGWRVQIKSERNSEIILLHVESMPTRELAVAAANEAVRVGIEDNRGFYRKQAIQLAEQFKRQSDAAAAEATVSREALIAYQTGHHLLEVSADTQAFLDSMGAVNERLHAARIARDSQKIRIANYRRLIAELPAEVMRESFEDDPLKRRIANSEVALMEARTRYGPENPRVLQIEDGIREMRRTMAEPAYNTSREKVYVPNPARKEFEMEVLRLEAEQEVLDRSVAQIEQQVAELRETYKHLPAQQLELAALHQRQAAAGALVRDLERSVADALRAADVDLADFELLEPARTATASQGKLAALLPVLAVTFGAFAGMGLCLVLALADPKLRSAGQVERLYTLPCLGTVPASRDAAAVPAAFLSVCRALYQRVTASPLTEGARVVCVLSACPGDGKSTLAFQAARYWAALGIKTACLDFDPAPNPWLKPADDQAGIEDYLAGRAAWEDIMFRREEVACFKRKRDTGNLPEHMHGKSMRRFMETLRAQYGCVIVEAPAWLTEEPSARMLAEMTGLSVWIAASPLSTRPVLNKTFGSVDQAGIRPLGMILNRVQGADGLGKGWACGIMILFTENLAARGLLATVLTGLLVGIVGSGCRTPSSPIGNADPVLAAKQPAEGAAKAVERLPESFFRPYDPAAYRLAVGDVVEISVFGFPETVVATPVAPDGNLYYLFMDGVPAAGRAPVEVARDMEAALQQMFNHPSVSVLPRQFAENRFLAIGKVVYPNVYPLESALTLRQAIARAGGLAQGIYRGTTIELASLRDSYLLRNGERVPVDFEALIHRNDASQDIFVRPGDVIVIASGLGREVFLMGAVGEQKAAGYTDGMTLVELISGQSERGGGYYPTARLSKVLIVRGALDNPTTFDVDLARILKGQDPDVFLMPGDIVYVPEKPYRVARDLTRAVVLTFVRTFASEAGAALVDETIFLTTPSSNQGGEP